MEDDDETLSRNEDKPSPVEVKELILDEKTLVTEKVEQCQLAFPNDASAESSLVVEKREEGIAPSEEALTVETKLVVDLALEGGEKSVADIGDSPEAAVEEMVEQDKEPEGAVKEEAAAAEIEVDAAVGHGEKAICDINCQELATDESVAVSAGDESLEAKQETLANDDRTETEVEIGVGGGTKYASESPNSKIVASESELDSLEEVPAMAKDENAPVEAEAEEESGVGIEPLHNPVQKLDDSQAAGGEEVLKAEYGMETTTVASSAEIDAEASNSIGVVDIVFSELQDPEVGAESLTVHHGEDKTEEKVEGPLVAELDISREMDIETEGLVKSEASEGSGFIDAEGKNATENEENAESGEEEEIPAAADKTDAEMDTDVETRGDEAGSALDDSLAVSQDEEDEAMIADEETVNADTEEMETETDGTESGKAAAGKRKRGRSSKSLVKVAARPPSRKTVEEDVCFICFDGGDLVLCDRRGCPKAYHPSCVNRDEAFFRAKGRWNCGWHLCSICEKNARYMCYTCTFSLCRSCIKDAVILCVRGNKGFCETCMRIVMLIESNEQKKDMQSQIDFDDRSSWEYLFKDYFVELKRKLSLSSAEIADAKNPWRGSDVSSGKQEAPVSHVDTNDDGASDSDNTENLELSKSKRRKVRKRSKSVVKEPDMVAAAVSTGSQSNPTAGNAEWASKELLEFVMHMKNGDASILSQFDVQALLLEYIKRNKLRDPRRKSQIICDSRLESLFGKPRVGHFEMLKLLESHFLLREDTQIDDVQESVVDAEIDQLDCDASTETPKGVKDRRRKTRKRGDNRGPQSNLDDYAAIDIHNISLIFLRRKLMEDLLEDIEKFQDKVVGTFVRIRISGSTQKQDIYRLVQVIGTSKAAEPYKVGKTTTDILLEILNLNKTEIISMDTISNQEFTEEECKRLRQSIKCGLINRLTVGDILDKAMEMQAARVNDWLESEIVRLSHLRDRASEKGRRKELRECVEKLQLLKTPEERRRRLEEIPEIHSDPNMDPSHESEEDDSENDDNRRGYMRTRDSGFGLRARGPISPGSNFSSKDSWSGSGKFPSRELNRNLSSKNIFSKNEDAMQISDMPSDNSWNQGREGDAQESIVLEKHGLVTNSETVGHNISLSRVESFSGAASVTSPTPLPATTTETVVKINETEKIWHYKDPSGKVQGPFSMVQLRKWSNTGYFPADLKIWRTVERQEDSILLTDALAGQFNKEKVENRFSTTSIQSREGLDAKGPSVDQSHGSQNALHLGSSRGGITASVEVPKVSAERWSGNDLSDLPSPTPKQGNAGWAGGEGVVAVTSHLGVNEVLQSQAAALPDSGSYSPASTAVVNAGGQLLRGRDTDTVNSDAVFSPAPSFEQSYLVGSVNSLLKSQSTVSNEQNLLSVHSHMPTNRDVAARSDQPVNVQSQNVETHNWGTAPSQKVEPIPSVSVPGQPQAYAQWGGITSSVQNSAGNFSNTPQQDLWRPPTQGSQPSMQTQGMPNVQAQGAPNIPWGLGLAENNSSTQGFRPENPNMGWSTMQGNPSMGWGGPGPGNTNINWGSNVQTVPPVNTNSGWILPTGNPGAPIQGPMPGNGSTAWVAPSVNPGVQGLATGNANPAWVAPSGNVGSSVQGPVPGSGWGPNPANPGGNVQMPALANANQGWNPPVGNQDTRGTGQHHNEGKFSGQRNGGRSYRQSSFGSGRSGGSSRPLFRRNVPCPYNKNGQCKKGAACDYLHS